MSSGTSVLQRPAVTSHIFKFTTNTVKRAVELAHVCCDFRDAVVNYSPGTWANIIAHDQRGMTHCIRNGTVLTFPVVAVVRQGTDSYLVEALKLARSLSNRRLIHGLVRVFADRVNRLPLPQLLAAVSTADLCAWLLNEPQPIAEAFDANWIAAALFRQPQEQQPHMLLEFARRVAALPAPPTGLASSGWSFFIAVFLVAAASTSEAIEWLQQFPFRFSVTHPEAREWFGQLVRARIGQQQQSDSFWFNDLAPALLRIVHETRNEDKQDQQIVTAASNAASLLFAVRISNFAADLSGCVLEDCNLAAADFTNVALKSDDHGEAKLRECVVVDQCIIIDDMHETKQLLERGKRREVLNTLGGHTSEVTSVAFSRDGPLIASGSRDNTVRVWDAATGICIRTLSEHKDIVYSVAISLDSTRIASGSFDNTVKVWDTATSNCIHTLGEHTAAVYSVAFSPDGTRIASCGVDKTVKVWDTATSNCIHTLGEHTAAVYSVAFSRDGTLIASGSRDNTVRVWSAATGNCIRTLGGHKDIVYSVAFSPEGTRIASCTDIVIKVWDAVTGSCILTLRGHTAAVLGVAFSPDGKNIVSCGVDNTIKLWDAAIGNCICTLSGHTDWVFGVAFSTDGNSIVSGGSDKTVKVWDAATGTCMQTFSEHTAAVYCVAFSPDGTRIVSVSRDNTVKVWSAATGNCTQSFSGDTDLVLGVDFSPDDTRIVSGSRDSTIKLWDAATGTCISAFNRCGGVSIAAGVAVDSVDQASVNARGQQHAVPWKIEVLSRTLHRGGSGFVPPPPGGFSVPHPDFDAYY